MQVLPITGQAPNVARVCKPIAVVWVWAPLKARKLTPRLCTSKFIAARVSDRCEGWREGAWCEGCEERALVCSNSDFCNSGKLSAGLLSAAATHDDSDYRRAMGASKFSSAVLFLPMLHIIRKIYFCNP